MGPRVRRPLVRYLALVLVVVLGGLSLAAFFVTRHAADDEEARLLHERSGEVAALLTSSTDNISSTLRLLGETYAGRNEEAAPGFVASARSLIKDRVTTVGVAQPEGSGVVVRAAEGKGPGVGTRLDTDRERLARRALDTRDLVSALVRDTSTGRTTLVLAFGRDDGLVVYQESAVDPTRPVPSTADSPFRALDVVLYRSPTASSDELVITTTADLPLPGSADRRVLKVGADRWLLVTSANESLAGSLAQSVPWIILGVGLTAALIAGGIVELLTRRREYALALVDERTATLRQTLDDLEAAREAADAANRSKSGFLSRMSHELRTPLNAVSGFAQLLELGDLDQEQREAVDQILKGGNHLLELINEVLDISRIESGDLALSPEPVLASSVLSDAMELIRPLASQHSIQLVGDRHATCGTYVFADRQRLKQILLNLLSNAVKYNRVGGTVSVSCEQPEPTRLRLKVADTGPGLRPDQLSRLFVPFERLGADRTDIEGTGIGLALSRRLAEAMGGTLDVDSRLGQGSTFYVELPLVEGPVERYERLDGRGQVPEVGRATGVKRHAVVYIEDNLANLKLVQRVTANRDDIEIIPAMQGRLGIELAREHQPVLILLDLHLPDLDGEQVVQQLRDDPDTAAIPVIIVSADATTGRVQRLLSAGAVAYLTKPFDVRELLRIFDDLLPDEAPLTSSTSE